MQTHLLKILIYNGPGTSASSIKHFTKQIAAFGFTIEAIDAKDLQNKLVLDQVWGIVFPGGRDIPYHNALQGNSNRCIRDFVKNGGNYIGICAGAYYGCDSIEFEKGYPLEVIGERELKFFPGKAVGTVYHPGTFTYCSEVGARKASITKDNQTYRVYYNGGCTFTPIKSLLNTHIIATYADIPDSPPAIISCQYGKGTALLSGIHFEYGPAKLFKALMTDLIQNHSDHSTSSKAL